MSVIADEEPLLRVVDLTVELAGGAPIVKGLSFQLARGEILGIVGESGSGKTTTGLALLGYTRPGSSISTGSVTIGGRELVGRSEIELRRLRGSLVSYVPQEPGSSLNPAIRVGDWLGEVLRVHSPSRNTKDAVGAAFERVGLPSTRDFLRRYIHQLSGGQQQRVAIATALVGEPPLVVLDEPTTGLDVVTQSVILDEVRRLQETLGISMIYISHNLAVVSSLADRVAVMYAGRIVEVGPTDEVLETPRHPYTKGLIESVPDPVVRHRLDSMPGVAPGVGSPIVGCAFAARCPQAVERCVAAFPDLEAVNHEHRVRCSEWPRTAGVVRIPATPSDEARDSRPLLGVIGLEASYPTAAGPVVAVRGVTFQVGRGESVSVVGESGSGKTTIARCIAGLHVPRSGVIELDGCVMEPRARDRPLDHRKRVQIVFQNPNDSLNPDHRIGAAISRPLSLLLGMRGAEARDRVYDLLRLVRLPDSVANRYPYEISGGERQRVAIARALAAEPDLLVCDEITSALDVSVQAAVLEVLTDLRVQLGLALLFITHDLGVVSTIGDRALVLERGIVCEQGQTRELLTNPAHDYTQTLVASAPRLPDAPASERP